MSFYEICGGRPLRGELRVQGAKNSALPILAAALLAPGQSVIRNCPDLSDVTAALEILPLEYPEDSADSRFRLADPYLPIPALLALVSFA